MKNIFVSTFLMGILFSCQSTVLEKEKEAARATIELHLNSVASRDIEHLTSTLPEDGEMLLILPDQEIINTTEGFIDFHKEWFEDTSWTFESKIIKFHAGLYFGMAVVEVMYKEPDRNGKPYFNRMIVSYDLEKQNGQWVIIKDHASSIEKD